MPVTEFLLFAAFILGMALPGMWLYLWAAKKAGVKPMRYYKKISFDNCTFVRDSRTYQKYRSCFRLKKGGAVSVEVLHSRGSMVLEFYTEDGRVLQSWRNGDPAAFFGGASAQSAGLLAGGYGPFLRLYHLSIGNGRLSSDCLFRLAADRKRRPI